MKTAAISFNKKGNSIAEKINKAYSVDLYAKSCEDSFNIVELTGKLMQEYEAIIFISSTGIAVRAIAPYLKDKTIDPAVLVVDTFGQYVISLLSGHLGGANSLALKISEILKAEPIITTATDSLGIAAPDIIAKENNLIIDDLKKAKAIAALLVDEKEVAFIDEDNKIKIPKGYTENVEGAAGIVYVTNKCKENFSAERDLKILKLIRRNIILGIGCKKDYPPEKMRDIVLEKLMEQNIDKRAVKVLATVEVKKDEKAILELSEFLQAELKIFTKEDIVKVQHKYKGSDFVEKNIGVRAVCEPCVDLYGGELLTSKISCEGMTLCIGRSE